MQNKDKIHFCKILILLENPKAQATQIFSPSPLCVSVPISLNVFGTALANHLTVLVNMFVACSVITRHLSELSKLG